MMTLYACLIKIAFIISIFILEETEFDLLCYFISFLGFDTTTVSTMMTLYAYLVKIVFFLSIFKKDSDIPCYLIFFLRFDSTKDLMTPSENLISILFFLLLVILNKTASDFPCYCIPFLRFDTSTDSVMMTLYKRLIKIAFILSFVILSATAGYLLCYFISFSRFDPTRDFAMMTLHTCVIQIAFILSFLILNEAASYLLYYFISFLRFDTTATSAMMTLFTCFIEIAFILSIVILNVTASYLLFYFISFLMFDTTTDSAMPLYTRLIEIPRLLVSTTIMVVAWVLIPFYFENLKTFPYVKGNRFILLSTTTEILLGENEFEQKKVFFMGKILPPTHPASVRVQMIVNNIIHPLQIRLRNEQERSDLDYAAKHTSHLDGLNWEVLVVNEPDVNAFSLPGGKIVVFTGLLEHFTSDAEIATIIGHEVGHVVARHSAERFTKIQLFDILERKYFRSATPKIFNTMSSLFLRLPFSRRIEMEADCIGLVLLALAGYDPRVAPSVYEKLGKVTGDSKLRDYLSTHPSGRKRAKLLAQAKIMEAALTIYRDIRAGRGVEVFL